MITPPWSWDKVKTQASFVLQKWAELKVQLYRFNCLTNILHHKEKQLEVNVMIMEQ